jgi:hypothetical protein
MRLAGSIVCLCLLGASPSWAASVIKELTRDNVESQSFEFKFRRADYWFGSMIKVTVRSKKEDLSKICEQVGARLYRCQESPDQFGLQMDTASAKETDGSLVYTFRVPKDTHKCFYFWRGGYELPGYDIWWVSLDSPLVRREGTPK